MLSSSNVRKGKRNRHFDNDDDEILVIPDLEDAEDEDITTKIVLETPFHIFLFDFDVVLSFDSAE